MARPLTESLDWAESFGHSNHGYTDLDAQQGGTSAWRAWRRGVALAVIIGTAVGWTIGTTVRRAGGNVATLAGPPGDSTSILQERFPELDVLETVRSAMTGGVQVTNDYMLSSAHQLDLYPWEHVAEPRRTTVLALKNWPDTLMSDFTFR